MPDERYGLPLPVTGDLDTANPKGNRPYGTLVEAKDLSGRFWGPREGSQSFTRAWETDGPGNGTLYDGITLLGTNQVAGVASSYEHQFRDLGTTFTLDIWFRLDETAYATSDDEIGLYSFNTSVGAISVGIHGGTQGGNATKVLVAIDTSTTRSTAASTVSFTSTNTVSAGTDQEDKHHLRIVRDGATATLFIDGVQEGQTTGLSAINPINGPLDTRAIVQLGGSGTSDVALKGAIFGCVLRDGTYDSLPIEGVMPHSPWAPNVHHYYLGRNIDFGGGGRPLLRRRPLRRARASAGSVFGRLEHQREQRRHRARAVHCSGDADLDDAHEPYRYVRTCGGAFSQRQSTRDHSRFPVRRNVGQHDARRSVLR